MMDWVRNVLLKKSCFKIEKSTRVYSITVCVKDVNFRVKVEIKLKLLNGILF